MRYYLYDRRSGYAAGNPYSYVYLKGDPTFKSGSTLPGWKNIIKARGNATTDYVRSDLLITPTTGSITYTLNDQVSYLTTTASNMNLDGIPLFNAELYNSAMAEFELKLGRYLANKVASDAMLGVTLGEMNETVRMLAHPFKSAVDLINSYGVRSARIRSKVLAVDPARPGSLRGKRIKYLSTVKQRNSALHAINDLYLEMTYGVTPLLSDIKNISAAYISHPVRHAEDAHTSVKAEARFDVPSHGWDPCEPNVSTFNFRIRYKETVTIRQFWRLLFEAQADTSKFSLDLNSFVPTLYELLPYSFVFDYISNLGDMINLMCYPTPSFIYGYRNIRQVQDGVSYLGGTTGPVDVHHRYQFPDYPFMRYKFQRGKALMPDRHVTLHVPSARQALNSMSLALSLFR